MPVDKFGRMSDTKTKDTGVSLTYINNNYVRSDGGTPLTGSLDMSFNKLVNLHKPTEQYDAVTKDYVDYIEKEIREKLEEEIKEKLEKEMMEKLKKRSQLIVVHGSYYGDLRKHEFQFNFGGYSIYNNDSNYCNGFVMPHSGRIKKLSGDVINEKGHVIRKMDSDYDDIDYETRRSLNKFNYWFSIIILTGFSNRDLINDELGRYYCGHVYSNEKDINSLHCSYVLVDKFENRKIEEGDIVTIDIKQELSFKPHIVSKDVKFSYLFTLLIELDPF